MKFTKLEIAGCWLIEPSVFRDERGSFTKTYHQELFEDQGIKFETKEEFFSVSKKNVLRGLHFQTPPAAHDKLVHCVNGSVLDFFVDIRKESSTYGKHLKIDLSKDNALVLFLPKGIAHGFLSLQDDSVMVYKTNHVYAPDHDTGLLWSSCDIELPIDEPIVSERDMSFPHLNEFASPFDYESQ